MIMPGDGESAPAYERVARQPGASPDGPATAPPPAAADPGQNPGETAAPPAAAGLTRKDYVDAIVKRSIFDSTKVGGSSAGDCVGEGCDGERSDLPFTLLATLVAIPEDRSSALLFNENTKEAWGYGIGARLMDATILTIEPSRVTVQRGDGSREFITVQGQEDKGSTAASSEPPAEGDASGEVTQISDTEFEVSRSLLDRYMSDMDALSKLARARPHKDAAGANDGYRLSGVRRNEALYQLGIRSGDIVHSVNGKPLTDMGNAMSAFSQLQGGSDFSFEITRRGERKTMSYRVK
jgi:type II secretion system protein C